MKPRHPYCEEPLSYDYMDIVRLLRGAGYDRYAAYVQQLGRNASDTAMVERVWQERYAEIVQRLHVYEPPAPVVEDRCGKPSEMSDG